MKERALVCFMWQYASHVMLVMQANPATPPNQAHAIETDIAGR
jgi:hypothetical protein